MGGGGAGVLLYGDRLLQHLLRLLHHGQRCGVRGALLLQTQQLTFRCFPSAQQTHIHTATPTCKWSANRSDLNHYFTLKAQYSLLSSEQQAGESGPHMFVLSYWCYIVFILTQNHDSHEAHLWFHTFAFFLLIKSKHSYAGKLLQIELKPL